MDKRFDEIVAAQLDLPADELSDDLGPRTLASWTSLKHIQLVAAIEDEFGVKLVAREIRSIRTVGDLRRIVAGKDAA
ncbi:acyl carrier protein [Krasilnikovia sp. M28-CT-15]|uniref:acyl carrier protein n=1 Tax=Krasilnikovia sp. M28-CT-15 TaxID=3373540 RepID=UPI003875B14B